MFTVHLSTLASSSRKLMVIIWGFWQFPESILGQRTCPTQAPRTALTGLKHLGLLSFS